MGPRRSIFASEGASCTAKAISRFGWNSRWSRPMPANTSVAYDELADLLDEYVRLTSFIEGAYLLQDVAAAVHLAVVDEEDYDDLYAALIAEIAVEKSEWRPAAMASTSPTTRNEQPAQAPRQAYCEASGDQGEASPSRLRLGER